MLIASFLICSHRGLRKACMKVTPSSPYNQGELRHAAGGCDGIDTLANTWEPLRLSAQMFQGTVARMVPLHPVL